MKTAITSAGVERLDDARVLWERLNAHHMSVSPYFADRFARFTFEERKARILEIAENGAVRLFFAEGGGFTQGQCIASVAGGEGEILSLYVDERYRGTGAAHALMRAALDWFEREAVRDVAVAVVHGNERAFSFYARYGLLPATAILKRKAG